MLGTLQQHNPTAPPAWILVLLLLLFCWGDLLQRTRVLQQLAAQQQPQQPACGPTTGITHSTTTPAAIAAATACWPGPADSLPSSSSSAGVGCAMDPSLVIWTLATGTERMPAGPHRAQPTPTAMGRTKTMTLGAHSSACAHTAADHSTQQSTHMAEHSTHDRAHTCWCAHNRAHTHTHNRATQCNTCVGSRLPRAKALSLTTVCACLSPAAAHTAFPSRPTQLSPTPCQSPLQSPSTRVSKVDSLCPVCRIGQSAGSVQVQRHNLQCRFCW